MADRDLSTTGWCLVLSVSEHECFVHIALFDGCRLQYRPGLPVTACGAFGVAVVRRVASATT